jgi:hypothetical protein
MSTPLRQVLPQEKGAALAVADVTAFQAAICSCTQVINTLRKLGTKREENSLQSDFVDRKIEKSCRPTERLEKRRLSESYEKKKILKKRLIGARSALNSPRS